MLECKAKNVHIFLIVQFTFLNFLLIWNVVKTVTYNHKGELWETVFLNPDQGILSLNETSQTL